MVAGVRGERVTWGRERPSAVCGSCGKLGSMIPVVLNLRIRRPGLVCRSCLRGAIRVLEGEADEVREGL